MQACFRAISILGRLLVAFLLLEGVDRTDDSGLSSSQKKVEKVIFPVVIDNERNPTPYEGKAWKISFSEDLTIGVKEGDEN